MFYPQLGRQYSFLEIDHEIFSIIFSFSLIQERQLLAKTKPAQ